MARIAALYLAKWHRDNHADYESCYYFKGCMEIDRRFERAKTRNEL